MNIFRLLETRGLTMWLSGISHQIFEEVMLHNRSRCLRNVKKGLCRARTQTLKRKWLCLILAPLRGCSEASSESVERHFQFQLDPTTAGINCSSPHESPLLRWHRPQAHRNESVVSHLLLTATFLSLFLLAKPAAHQLAKEKDNFLSFSSSPMYTYTRRMDLELKEKTLATYTNIKFQTFHNCFLEISFQSFPLQNFHK